MQAFYTLGSTTAVVVDHNIFIAAEGRLCSRDDPQYNASVKQVKELKRGTYPTIALTVDGHAWINTSPQATWFKPITLNERVVQVAVGHDHSVLLTESGQLYVAGSNKYGQLGLGVGGRRYTFTLVEGLPIVTQVAANSHHTVAISEEGELWVCGSNAYGQLGLGDNEARNSFTRVNLTECVLTVDPGNISTVLTTSNGELVSGLSYVGGQESSTVFRPGVNYRRS